MQLSTSSPRGVNSVNPREFDCDVYSQVRDFDRKSCPQDVEFWHLGYGGESGYEDKD